MNLPTWGVNDKEGNVPELAPGTEVLAWWLWVDGLGQWVEKEEEEDERRRRHTHKYVPIKTMTVRPPAWQTHHRRPVGKDCRCICIIEERG